MAARKKTGRKIGRSGNVQATRGDASAIGHDLARAIEHAHSTEFIAHATGRPVQDGSV